MTSDPDIVRVHIPYNPDRPDEYSHYLYGVRIKVSDDGTRTTVRTPSGIHDYPTRDVR